MCELNKQDQIALEELRQLQLIIGRQDELKAKTKSLAISLFSALTAAFVSQKILMLDQIEYFVITLILAVLFFLIETVYGATEINAEDRVKEIEKYFQTNGNYLGPKIYQSLTISVNFEQLKLAAKRLRTNLLYLTLLIISILVIVCTVLSPNKMLYPTGR